MSLTSVKIETKKLAGQLNFEEGSVDITPLLSAELTDESFFDFCRLNNEWQIEMTKEGSVIIMPPTGSETGRKSFKLTVKFGIWVEKDGTGEGFDSSAGFTLPNGAKRSPDVSWIKNERWNALSDEKKKRFAPICPDFVAEIRSETDSLSALKDKMQEYLENGARLGWLIDPLERKVYVYRNNQTVEVLENPESISGESLLKTFELNLNDIW